MLKNTIFSRILGTFLHKIHAISNSWQPSPNPCAHQRPVCGVAAVAVAAATAASAAALIDYDPG